jgi:hypothetical protein
MAKSKETDETVVSDAPVVQEPASVAPVVEAPASVPEVKSKKKKFKLLGGKYHTSTKVYKPGDIVESDDDLAAIWGKPTFELVEG